MTVEFDFRLDPNIPDSEKPSLFSDVSAEKDAMAPKLLTHALKDIESFGEGEAMANFVVEESAEITLAVDDAVSCSSVKEALRDFLCDGMVFCNSEPIG